MVFAAGVVNGALATLLLQAFWLAPHRDWSLDGLELLFGVTVALAVYGAGARVLLRTTERLPPVRAEVSG